MVELAASWPFPYLVDASDAPEERVHPVRVADLHGRGAEGDLQVQRVSILPREVSGTGGGRAKTGQQ